MAEFVSQQAGNRIRIAPSAFGDVLQSKEDRRPILIGCGPTGATADANIDDEGYVGIKRQGPLSALIERGTQSAKVLAGLCHRRQPRLYKGEDPLTGDLAPISALAGVVGLQFGSRLPTLRHILGGP